MVLCSTHFGCQISNMNSGIAKLYEHIFCIYDTYDSQSCQISPRYRCDASLVFLPLLPQVVPVDDLPGLLLWSSLTVEKVERFSR